MASTPVKSVFVSYAARDKKVAARLKERLRVATDEKLLFFVSGDGESISPGKDWFQDMSGALQKADAVLVLMSEHAERSPWVLYEAGFAAGIGTQVIPVLVPGYPPDRLCAPLSRLQCVEIQSTDSLNRIVKTLLGGDTDASFVSDDVSYIFGEDVVDLRERPAVEAVFLSSRNEIYNEIVRLIVASGRDARIRATSTLYESDSGETRLNPFDRYIRIVAAKIAEAAQDNGSADYTLVMSFDLDDDRMPPSDRQISIRNRLEVFREKDVLDRIKVLWRPDYWKIEVFILGDDHLVLGFPQEANSSRLHRGVRITGRDFVTHVAHWFELCIRSGALPVDPVTLQVQDRAPALRITRTTKKIPK